MQTERSPLPRPCNRIAVQAHVGRSRSTETATTCAGLACSASAIAREVRIVDADHRQVAGCLAVEDRALGSDIAGHVAVAVDVVGAEIEHRRRIEAERGESLQHVGRHLQHVDRRRPAAAAAPARRCRDCRPPRPALRRSARMCASSAVVVDLPLVPVMPTKRAREPARRTAWNSSSASDRIGTPAARARAAIGMRLRQPMRNAGRQHQRVEARNRPSHGSRSGTPPAAARAAAAVVPGGHLGAHRQQGAGDGRPLRPRPTTAKRLPANRSEGNALIGSSTSPGRPAPGSSR